MGHRDGDGNAWQELALSRSWEGKQKTSEKKIICFVLRFVPIPSIT
jgi:hypothetical protein